MGSLGDGFAGLFLFIANWLSPTDGTGELLHKSIEMTDTVITVECQQKFRWSDDATSIIDAGIPLLVTYYSTIDDSSEEQYTRILRSELDEEYYTVVDSLGEELFNSREYSNIYLAVREFQTVSFSIPTGNDEVEILGLLQPSPVSRMGKTVSLAPICGGDRFYQKIKIDTKP